MPPGGGDPMNLGTVESGGFEQYFQKPTPWVSIRGINRRFDEDDVKQALREKLDEEENEVNAVECFRRAGAQEEGNGRFYVKFEIVHEAKGCARMLDGRDLLGGNVGVKRVYEK